MVTKLIDDEMICVGSTHAGIGDNAFGFVPNRRVTRCILTDVQKEPTHKITALLQTDAEPGQVAGNSTAMSAHSSLQSEA